ncbi:MAG: hypothetical protein AAGI23_09635 [Bacteroidota bacterium]
MITHQLLPQFWAVSAFTYLSESTRSDNDELRIPFFQTLTLTGSLLILYVLIKGQDNKQISLTKDNYKQLKQNQLMFLQNDMNDDQASLQRLKVKWYHRPMLLIFSKLADQVKMLNEKIDLAFKDLDNDSFQKNGLKVITQDELWERRTTAYKYRR